MRIRVVSEEPGPGRIIRVQGAGSGIIISREGHVVTNHHVAGNATYLVCDLPDQRDLPARLVGTDPLGLAVTDTDTADVTVLVPAVDIQKTPDLQQVVAGGRKPAPWARNDNRLCRSFSVGHLTNSSRGYARALAQALGKVTPV